MILAGTDFQGLVLRPRHGVAMIREELGGRLEMLTADGALAHRPGPLEACEGPPFVRVAPGTLVHPGHARAEGGLLHLPGGWSIPGVLPTAKPREPRADDPFLPGGVRASQVLFVESDAGSAAWVTDRGRVPAPAGVHGAARLARFHPHLVRAGKHWRVNPLRLRSLRRQLGTDRCRLEFDQGTVLQPTMTAAAALARGLGLAHYDWVGGETDLQADLRVLGVRRWPFPLASAPAEFLAREFAGEPARLLADLALQTVEAQRRGESGPDGLRSWYYRVARGALQAAGHLGPPSVSPRARFVWRGSRPGQRHRPAEHRTFGIAPPLGRRDAWVLVCMVWGYLVGGLQLFRYSEAGFGDRKPEARRIGDRHPDVVLIVEKESLAEAAFRLHERFGVTVMVLGGNPTLIGSETLAAELLGRGVTTVRLVSLCDFDVAGWDMPRIQADHLQRYALRVAGLRRMVTPDRFTEDELRRLSVSLETSSEPEYQSRLARFMRESGGISGEPRGLYADFLLALDRVDAVFEAVAADWLARPRPLSHSLSSGSSGRMSVQFLHRTNCSR